MTVLGENVETFARVLGAVEMSTLTQDRRETGSLAAEAGC